MPRMSAAIVLALFAAAPRASADPVADFYKGQRITIIVGSETGGDYDVWARMIARYMGKYIPGHPSFLVQNMPGAGGIRASNHMYNLAARDGSQIAMSSRNSSFKALAREPGVMFDPVKFNWIGSPETTTRVCVVSNRSPVQTLPEIFEKEVIMAGAGAGTALSTVPPLLNRLLGAKMKLVEGYASSTAAKLAIDRGEVHGLCQSLSQIVRAYFQDLGAGRLKVLFSMEKDPPPEAKAPSIFEFTKTEQQRRVLSLFSVGVQIGRPVSAPPGVPAERVAALREAFAATMRDPELRAEAERQGFVANLVSGEKVAGMVEDLMNTPPDIRELAGNIGD